MVQKACFCKEIHPRCYTEGWQLCLTGSRFGSGAETRYSPIEGEAVAWALKKAKHFVMGCMNLHHKPLIGILSPDKALADIKNSRLRNLTAKVSAYVFITVHLKDLENNISDMVSRHPVEGEQHMEGELWRGQQDRALPRQGGELSQAT